MQVQEIFGMAGCHAKKHGLKPQCGHHGVQGCLPVLMVCKSEAREHVLRWSLLVTPGKVTYKSYYCP